MNKKYGYIVIEDGKPICIGYSLKHIRAYLDDYCGVGRENGEFVTYEPDNPKYPSDYQGKFIYKEFWSTKDGITEEIIHFRVYEVDVALPTIEQKREEDIDELLQ